MPPPTSPDQIHRSIKPTTSAMKPQPQPYQHPLTTQPNQKTPSNLPHLTPHNPHPNTNINTNTQSMTDNPENTRGTRKTQARTDKDDTSPTTTTTTTNPPQDTNPSSLASRIQSSAAGLARSAFHPGSAENAASTLAGATDGKAGGAGPSSAQGYTASQATLPPQPSRSTTSSGTGSLDPSTAGTSFRERTTGITEGEGGFSLPAMTEEEFQRGETYTPFTPAMTGAAGDTEGHAHMDMESLQAATGTWKGKQVARDPVQLEYNTAWERAGGQSSVPGSAPAPAVLDPSDGAAVVSLLSDASFDPVGDPSTEEGDVDMAASPPPLTASEIETLESFRREMGSSGGDGGVSGQSQSQLSSLSLVPDIDTFLQQNDPAGLARAAGNGSASLSNATLRDTVLENLPGAADWVGVQERYHDEVWGYLRPALEAARAEMEERGGGGEPRGEDGPAVRRLKMILKHMRA